MYQLLITLLLCVGFFGTANAAAQVDAKGQAGIVNFASCMTESKVGKKEQASFESLKKQMGTLLEDTEKQLNEISTKFNDPEYMDGLSPEAEEELKNKARMLNEEMNRYQQQYYQVLQQANMKILQAMSTNIQAASEKVAKEKQLTMVINKEACFFYTPALDVTSLVVAEMDKTFEVEAKKQSASLENNNASTPAVEKTNESKKK
ncbi:MAG TPA: OmpH family outer membrane protein [Rhabdochlamydiaceae bacterium]|nr:OmpH family outer membrane protein [Rhabdochlamydiaceae bacterium]